MASSFASFRSSALFILALSSAFLCPLRAATPVYQWTTVAGRASTGSEDGTGDKARFNQPYGLALDPTGNLYVADRSNHTIRKIAPGGAVTTLAGSPGQAGSADGMGAAARFSSPDGVAVDSFGAIYVADSGNYTIRKVSTTGVVTTLAGKAGVSAAQDGPVASALFKNPQQIGVDGTGIVYVLDAGGIRRISNGQVETLYQSGGTVTVPAAYFKPAVTGTVAEIGGIAVTTDGRVYFSVLLTFTPTTGNPLWTSPALLRRNAIGEVDFVYGGPYTFSYNNIHFGRMAADAAGNVAILGSADWMGARCPVFYIQADGTASPNTSLHFANGYDAEAHGIALNDAGDTYYSRSDTAIIRLAKNGTSNQLIAGVTVDSLPFESAWSVAPDESGNVWVARDNYYTAVGNYSDSFSLLKVAPDGAVTTVIKPNFVADLYGFAVPYVATGRSKEMFLLNGYIYHGTLTRIAADGTITDASLGQKPAGYQYFNVSGFVMDASGSPVISDRWSHALWRRAPDGNWSGVAGVDGTAGTADGTGDNARFGTLGTVIMDRDGTFYVLDTTVSGATNSVAEKCVIRRITAQGVVTTVSGNLLRDPLVAGGNPIEPSGLAIDSKGVFYLTYPGLNSVWRLEAAGTPTLIGGLAGSSGDADGVSDKARFYTPGAIAVDSQDRLLVIDYTAGTLRRAVLLLGPAITAQPQSVSTVAGGSAQFSVTATGNPTPTYQWNFNGAAISGATGASYSISSASASNAGNYTVTVSNSQGSTTSSNASLTVTGGSTGGGGGGGGSTGGGGGGGAPGVWFYTALAVATFARFRSRFFSSAKAV